MLDLHRRRLRVLVGPVVQELAHVRQEANVAGGLQLQETAEVQRDGAAPEVVVRPFARELLHVVRVTAPVACATVQRNVQRSRHPPDNSSIFKPHGSK
eukprot:4318126-Pyramimonas_sp.AAC.2